MANTSPDPLESFSLMEANQAFKKALEATGAEPVVPGCALGSFDWGSPIEIQFIFDRHYTQEQLQAILTTASSFGMQMEPLTFGRDSKLVFMARTKLLRP